MKNTLMIVLCSAAILVSGCASSHTHSAAWDYKVVEGYVATAVEKQLNQLASEGWIVVSSSSSVDSNMSYRVLVILKRHK
jgi:hypothetical protein